jgi:hypothetical protein
LLVDLKGIVRGLFQKGFIGDGANVRSLDAIFALDSLFGGWWRKLALLDKVATELLIGSCADRSPGTISFKSVGSFGSRFVKVLAIDPAEATR